MSITLPISLFQEFIVLVESKITYLVKSLDGEAPVVQALREINTKAKEIAGFEAARGQSHESTVPHNTRPPQQPIDHVLEEEMLETEVVQSQDDDNDKTRKVKKRRKRVSRKISKVSKSLN